MTGAIIFNEFRSEDFDALLELGQKLWKDSTKSELKVLFNSFFDSDHQKTILARDYRGIPIGFVIFSIRTDYVEGAKQSPTGYLEGIYVEPAYRKKGIARTFLSLGEQWMVKMNCVQMGSDTWLTDTESRKFHKKLGFKEEDELVHFIKEIQVNTSK